MSADRLLRETMAIFEASSNREVPADVKTIGKVLRTSGAQGRPGRTIYLTYLVSGMKNAVLFQIS